MERKTGEKAVSIESKENREYNLAERSTKFAEGIVTFARKLQRTPVTMPIITQLVKAGTSIGANNREADESVSLKEFRNKIGYCKKEANETKYWLRIVATAVPEIRDDARQLWREADELHKIFCASFRTADKAQKQKKAP